MGFLCQTNNRTDLYGVINLPPMLHDSKIEGKILPAEISENDEQKQTIRFGFLNDKVPPLPDSFFDPLPEEELRAWEL